MRLVIQRVSRASVTINKVVKSMIDNGLLILIGIEEADTEGYRMAMQKGYQPADIR